MALEPGSRLGAYEIIALVGAGGMGEVYRARDTRLSRDVAIKVLPDVVAADAGRRVRFEREAQVLASLNHGGIATIFGVEESGSRVGLVMELVEGPTLAERLAPGPMAIDEATAIARQICDALEYAHNRGIAHRDLKPANVKLKPDGTIKILDFGLAKAIDPDVAKSLTSADATHSPTLSLGVTHAGVILGTAAYMSPEQARGGAVDRRADIWGFGCVLFEMLVGKQPFSGETISDMLAAVLRVDPDWSTLPSTIPAHIQRLLRRCLQKDPQKRLQHIGDARLDLEDDGFLMPVAEPRPSSRRMTPLAVAAAIGLSVAIAGIVGWLVRPTPLERVRRFALAVPPSMPLRETSPGLVLSPDGNMLVYTTGAGDRDQLVKRRFDTGEFEPIRGSDFGASAPFFSPDGRWVGFFAQNQLKKIAIGGGTSTVICDSGGSSRGSWGDDDSIVFADTGGRLYRVSASGGTRQLIVNARTTPEGVFEPQFLPGSKALLFRSGGLVNARIDVLELPSLVRHPLVLGSAPQLASTGDLLFHRAGRLWAVGFDRRRLAVVGNPVPAIETIRMLANVPLFSVSRDGSIAYVSGAADSDGSLVWLDRGGRSTPAVEQRAPFETARLSPDGTRIAVNVPSGQADDIWVYDVERGTRLRLTIAGGNRRPVWSPDGRRIVFNSDIDGDTDLFVVSAMGGKPERLLRRPGAQFPDAWSPDGTSLVFNEGGSLRDLWLLPITPVGSPRLLVQTPFNERAASISPDGRWLAFAADDSGQDEVYVEPFPAGGSKVPVSTNGGRHPMWSRNGRELFYREGDHLVSVPVQTSPLRFGSPQRLFDFDGRVYGDNPNISNYDVAPDGRFLAVKSDPTAGSAEIQVVLNWSQELRRVLKK